MVCLLNRSSINYRLDILASDMTDVIESRGPSTVNATEFSSSEQCRRILSAADMDMWLHSEGYRDYLNFIKQLNEFAKRVHGTALKSRDDIVEPYLIKVTALLDKLCNLVDQIAPFNDDKNQRFAKVCRLCCSLSLIRCIA